MYARSRALGAGPARITDWFNHYASAGDVYRVVYGTANSVPANAKEIGEVLKQRNFRPIGYPPVANRFREVGVDMVALEPGKLGSRLGRFLVAGSLNATHEVQSVILLKTLAPAAAAAEAEKNRKELDRNARSVQRGRDVAKARDEVLDLPKAVVAGTGDLLNVVEFVTKNIVPIALIGGGVLVYTQRKTVMQLLKR
jgi:hypothetical protein